MHCLPNIVNNLTSLFLFLFFFSRDPFVSQGIYLGKFSNHLGEIIFLKNLIVVSQVSHFVSIFLNVLFSHVICVFIEQHVVNIKEIKLTYCVF